mmetsp:Transcript_3649/g.10155  ORF Transcript_3649/g.10155 Transcript_3649/m.10155 type:complete len:341 (-) Transcript_3649:853-1875(-)
MVPSVPTLPLRARGGASSSATPVVLRVPQIGLGLWKLERSAARDAVLNALKIGYRHLDSACDYGNESEVGQGIQAAIAEGICTRDELFVTSKLWNTFHRRQHVRAAATRTLSDLKLDQLDLYMIHFPSISLKYVPFEERYPPEWIHDPTASSPSMQLDPVPLQETWEAMESLVEEGLVKAIGLCNVNVQTLLDVLSYAKIKPAAVQIELHPYLTQTRLVRFCQERDIVTVAFSPLGSGSYVQLGMATAEESVLLNEAVAAIAAAKKRTPAQIILRWGVQRGTAVIPKSSKLERLEENYAIFDFELSDSEMSTISALERGRRLNDPGSFCQSMGAFVPIYD